MSPRRTFHSCGSSSSEVRRSRLPTPLIRWSLATLHRVADSWSSAGRSVRNLSSVNTRPSMPIRSCRKTTPGPSATRTASAHSAITGAAASSARQAREASRARLPQRPVRCPGTASGRTANPHRWSAETLRYPGPDVSTSHSRTPYPPSSRTSAWSSAAALPGPTNSAWRTVVWMTARPISSWVASTGSAELPSPAAGPSSAGVPGPLSTRPTGRIPYAGCAYSAALICWAAAPPPTISADWLRRAPTVRTSWWTAPRTAQPVSVCAVTAVASTVQSRTCQGPTAARHAAAVHHRTSAWPSSAGSSSSADGESLRR